MMGRGGKNEALQMFPALFIVSSSPAFDAPFFTSPPAIKKRCTRNRFVKPEAAFMRNHFNVLCLKHLVKLPKIKLCCDEVCCSHDGRGRRRDQQEASSRTS